MRVCHGLLTSVRLGPDDEKTKTTLRENTSESQLKQNSTMILLHPTECIPTMTKDIPLPVIPPCTDETKFSCNYGLSCKLQSENRSQTHIHQSSTCICQPHSPVVDTPNIQQRSNRMGNSILLRASDVPKHCMRRVDSTTDAN